MVSVYVNVPPGKNISIGSYLTYSK